MISFTVTIKGNDGFVRSIQALAGDFAAAVVKAGTLLTSFQRNSIETLRIASIEEETP